MWLLFTVLIVLAVALGSSIIHKFRWGGGGGRMLCLLCLLSLLSYLRGGGEGGRWREEAGADLYAIVLATPAEVAGVQREEGQERAMSCTGLPPPRPLCLLPAACGLPAAPAGRPCCACGGCCACCEARQGQQPPHPPPPAGLGELAVRPELPPDGWEAGCGWEQ